MGNDLTIKLHPPPNLGPKGTSEERINAVISLLSDDYIKENTLIPLRLELHHVNSLEGCHTQSNINNEEDFDVFTKIK